MLAYADDVLLLVEEEDEMRSVIERLEKYLDKKNELNREKTRKKIRRFWKGEGRIGKRIWRYKEKEIEEVKKFCYLGYIFQRNRGRIWGAHIKKRMKRAAAVMK